MVFCQEAAGAKELFVVENIQVDITADNVMNARDQAFAKAQQDALKALADRLLPESEATTFKVPDPAVISPMIQDYEVTQEKLSSVRYIGNYTFRFKDSAIKRYFAMNEVPYTDISSKPVLILPFYQLAGKTTLWTANPWLDAWNRGNLGDVLVPQIIPIGDLMDVKDIDDTDGLGYNEQTLARMLGRYQAQEAVIAMATPDAHLELVSSDAAPATGALTVNVYRTDRNGPEHVQQLVVTAQPGQTRGALYDQAVREVQSSLQKDWKSKTMIENTASPGMPAGRATGIIEAKIMFTGFREWATIQRRLERVPGVESVRMISLTPREARVEIAYQGDESRLRLALQQSDMILQGPPPAPDRRASGYNAPYGQHYEDPSVVVYDLYMNRTQTPPAVAVPSAQPYPQPQYQQPVNVPPSQPAPSAPGYYSNQF